MKAFGYEKPDPDDDLEQVIELREVSLQMTPDYLEQVIGFLNAVRDDMLRLPRPRPDPARAAHWHLRDWHPGWTRADVDLVVLEE